MINRFFIRLLMLGSPLLRSLGVNMYHLKVILQMKCSVDDRRPMGLNIYKNSNRRKSSYSKNILFLFFGLFLSVILFLPNLVLAHALYLTAFMVYVINSLIIDFSNVLIDVRDHYFIVSRPVNDQTVAVARILHILIYLGKMFIPLIISAILIVFIKSGIFSGFLFLVELASAICISVFSVNIIYMLMLQFMKPQQFRDIIAYFQIALSTLILGSYMLLPRLIESANLQHISPLDYTLSYFLPPVWIAMLQHWSLGVFNQVTYILSALAIITPIICLVAVVKFLSGNFNNKLSQMGAATEQSDQNKQEVDTGKLSYADRLANFFTTDPIERLGFKITWKLTSRLREFKTRVYPSIAYLPIYFIYFVFIQSDRSWAEQWDYLSQSHFYLFFLYSIGFLSIVLVRQITRSKKIRAAWFYQIMPNKNPGRVLYGMIKSVIVKYLLPIAIVLTAFTLWVWGFGISLNIIYALITQLLITAAIALTSARKFPFSEPATMEDQKGNVFLNLILILLPLGLGYFQSYISSYSTIIGILSIIYLSAIAGMFYVYKNLTWDEIGGE